MSTPVLDHAEGLRRMRGNEKLYCELASLFLSDVPRLTGLLRDAVARGSAKDMQYAAHSLKGSASQLGARAVTLRAQTLEAMGDLGEATAQLALLDDELRVLSVALTALLDTPQSGAT